MDGINKKTTALFAGIRSGLVKKDKKKDNHKEKDKDKHKHEKEKDKGNTDRIIPHSNGKTEKLVPSGVKRDEPVVVSPRKDESMSLNKSSPLDKMPSESEISMTFAFLFCR